MSQWHRYIALTNPVHFLFDLNFLTKLSRPFKYLHNKRQIRFCQLSHYYLILKHVSSIHSPTNEKSKLMTVGELVEILNLLLTATVALSLT
jgi:hypothetical protein